MPSARSVALLCALAASGGLAGCGSGDDAGGRAATPAPAATSTAEGGSGGSGDAQDAVTVRIKDFEYAPKTARVRAGGKVTWVDEDAANHTATFENGLDTGNIRTGGRRSLTFERAGTFTYVCEYHPGMEGTVDVSR